MINVKLDGKAKATVSKTAGITGTSYTAGNGIEITNENVINADTKVVVYDDPTTISSDVLESLNVGDALNVNNTYYFVTTKNQWNVEIINVGTYGVHIYSYVKDGEYYRFDYQDIRNFPAHDSSAYLEGDEGEIDWDIYDQIGYQAYCMTDYGMAIPIGWDEETDTPKLSTVVQDNKYYTVAFTYNEPESEEEDGTYSYVITEHTLGGNENVGIEYVEAGEFTPSVNIYNSFNSKYIQDRDFRAALLNGAYLIYNDIVLYPTMRTKDDSSITITYTSPEILGKKFIIDARMDISGEGAFLYLSVEYSPNVITGYKANCLIFKNSHAGASADALLSLLTQFGINTSNSFQNINIANLITIGLSNTEDPIYYFKFGEETIYSVESTSLTNPSMADVVNEVFQGELHTDQDALATFPLVVVIGDTNNGNHTSYPISTIEFSHLVYNWIDK